MGIDFKLFREKLRSVSQRFVFHFLTVIIILKLTGSVINMRIFHQFKLFTVHFYSNCTMNILF